MRRQHLPGSIAVTLVSLIASSGCVCAGFDPRDRGPSDGARDIAADGARDLAADGAGDLVADGDLTLSPLKLVPSGTFTMGSPGIELCREPWSSKETQHQVTLSRSFLIPTTEITQAQFAALMGYNPSKKASCGSACPVESLSWHEAAAFCNALSSKASLERCYACTGSGRNVTCAEASAYQQGQIYACPGFRLPTEAEWELAYRAGTSTAFHTGPITSCSVDNNAGLAG